MCPLTSPQRKLPVVEYAEALLVNMFSVWLRAARCVCVCVRYSGDRPTVASTWKTILTEALPTPAQMNWDYCPVIRNTQLFKCRLFPLVIPLMLGRGPSGERCQDQRVLSDLLAEKKFQLIWMSSWNSVNWFHCVHPASAGVLWSGKFVK